MIIELDARMKEAAGNLDFELAIELRNRMLELKKKIGES